MTAPTRNPAIGTCPCPVPKCGEPCEVRKFQNRSTRDTGHRFAGRLYLICPKHGRLGMDAKDAMQDYILEHARMFNAEEKAPAPAAVAPPAAAPKPAPPAPPAAAAEKPKPRAGLADWDW